MSWERRQDYSGFSVCLLGYDMDLEFKTRNDKQLQAAEAWINDVAEQMLYGGAKGGGKSFLGAALIFGNALAYPGTHYFIARRELIDLRRFTMPTISEFFQKVGLRMEEKMMNGEKCCVFNGQDHVYKLYNGSQVFLITCKDEPSDPLFERFGSMQMTQGWIEEGGEVPEAAKDNLWLSVGRWKNQEYNLPPKLLITANPKKGWMKREFVDPFNQGKLPETHVYIQAFASDNTYLPPSYELKLKADKDNVRRQRLAEGNWEYDDDKDSLITYDGLSDAFSNTITKDGDQYLIVDVGRKRDRTVFSFWQGLEVYRIECFEKQATNKTEQQVKDFAAMERIPYSHILIDEDGIGGGVVDHLPGVKGFNANSQPILTAAQIRERQKKVQHGFVNARKYANIKAQCGWKLAELINEHEIAFKTPEYREDIVEELTAQLRDREPDRDGKKMLIDKLEVKKEIKRSPDIGDTFVMRMFFELVKESGTGGVDEATVKKAQEEQSVRFARNRNQTRRGQQSNK